MHPPLHVNYSLDSQETIYNNSSVLQVSRMPKLWVQVVGTQRPIQVQYEDGDNVDDLKTAAKPKMPTTLTVDLKHPKMKDKINCV